MEKLLVLTHCSALSASTPLVWQQEGHRALKTECWHAAVDELTATRCMQMICIRFKVLVITAASSIIFCCVSE